MSLAADRPVRALIVPAAEIADLLLSPVRTGGNYLAVDSTVLLGNLELALLELTRLSARCCGRVVIGRLQRLRLPVHAATRLDFPLRAHHGHDRPFAPGEVRMLLTTNGRALGWADRVGVLRDAHRCHVPRRWLHSAAIVVADHVRVSMVPLTVPASVLL